MRRISYLSVSLCFILGLVACKHEPSPVASTVTDYGNFPEPVGKIFITKCATAGCHNDKSYEGAGDLRLDQWEHLFAGGDNGAPVIPYSPEYSSLLYFINPDSSLGLVSEPRMPKDAAPLSREEYLVIRNWVAAGAPDKDGNIPFGSEPATRQKIYLTQQGCDLVGVIDAEKRVLMRYIKVGMDEGKPENPHNIKMSPDGKYAYVCFSTGDYLQKIETATDKVIASLKINIDDNSTSQFNVLTISPDGSEIIVSDMSQQGRVMLVDANSMTFKLNYNAGFENPHGVAANASFDTFFVTGQYGNTVYKFSKDGNYINKISLDGTPARTSSFPGSGNPHDLLMTPDRSKYFVTCENNAKVVAIDAHTDKIIATIPVGVKPQELAISPKTGKLFVTCQLEPSTEGGKFVGAVYMIDYNNPMAAPVRIDGRFSQPHGVAVDEEHGLVYISSVNVDGPPPHHPSACSGNNGYYQVFDLYTLKPYGNKDKRYEVSVFPYSAATRFNTAN